MSGSLLEITGLRPGYGPVTILHGIDMRIGINIVQAYPNTQII